MAQAVSSTDLTACEKYNIVLFICYLNRSGMESTSRWLRAGTSGTPRRRLLPPSLPLELPFILFSSMKWLHEDGMSRYFASSPLATVAGVQDDSLNICKNNIWSQVCSKSESELDCYRATVAYGRDPMPVCSMLVLILTERTYRKNIVIIIIL